jgi:hypothetical protein
MIAGMICEVDFSDAVASQGQRRPLFSKKSIASVPFSDQRQHTMMLVAN